jgi:hypothetical protein
MTLTLVLLERAIESVGPDALLPEVAIEGPAEVRVAAKALNSLSSRLKTAMQSRMRLVAAAGHDLRTPIARMCLRAEFVCLGLCRRSPARHHQFQRRKMKPSDECPTRHGSACGTNEREDDCKAFEPGGCR